MHIGPAGQHAHAAAGPHQLRSDRLRPRDRPLLALAERLTRRDPQRHRLTRDHVLQRPSLLTREHRRIDPLGELLPAQNHPAPPAADRLMNRGRHDVGVRHRTRMQPRRDQAGEMRHIDDQIRADVVRDRAKPLEIEHTRIRRPAGQNHMRAALVRDPLDLVHIDQARLPIHVIRRDLIKTPRNVDRHPMGQMTTVGQLEPHHRVPRLKQRVIHRRVRLRPRMRLHIRALSPEQLDRALDRQPLGHIDVLAPAVVTLTRIPLRVLIRQHRPLTLQHRRRNEILRRDHLQRPLLTLELQRQHLRDLRIDLGQRTIEEIGGQVGGGHSTHEPSNGNGRCCCRREVTFASPRPRPNRLVPTPRAVPVRPR